MQILMWLMVATQRGNRDARRVDQGEKFEIAQGSVAIGARTSCH